MYLYSTLLHERKHDITQKQSFSPREHNNPILNVCYYLIYM